MEDDDKHSGIGQRLRVARERAGLTREALAVHSGISWSAIAQVEAGRRVNLRPSTLAALARALRVTIDYLVSGRPPSRTMLEHQLLPYETEEEILSSAAEFLADAVRRSEAALVITSAARIERLRAPLGAGSGRVEFADRRSFETPIDTLRGIRGFVDRSLEAGAPWVRIFAEPVREIRSQTALRQWQRCESLLNLVFGHAPVTLVCAYDTRELGADILEQIRGCHPGALEPGGAANGEDCAEAEDLVLGL